MKCAICNDDCVWIGWGLDQRSNGEFIHVELFLCTRCRTPSLRFNENRREFPGRGTMAYCKFVFNRDISKWPTQPKDKYDKYAKEHGISRLHAIHEIDGA